MYAVMRLPPSRPAPLTLCLYTLGMTVNSDSDSTVNDQDPPPVNEADLKDNKGEPKESKLLESGEDKCAKEEEKKSPGDEPGEGVSTKYRLRGVVVHSGQASGGHYYSFVNLRCVGVYSPLLCCVFCSTLSLLAGTKFVFIVPWFSLVAVKVSCHISIVE